MSANAYLGGFGIAEALSGGADVVVTGRVTDASLVVGPAAWHFGWQRTDWDRLAGAVVVGHVIECGTQTTGGNYAFFREVPGLEHPGFPIAEMAEDGSAVITKHEGTGGLVSVGTVTAQLLYEIGGAALCQSRRGGGLLDHPRRGRGRRPGTCLGGAGPACAGEAQGVDQPAGRLPQHHDLRAHRPRHRRQGGARAPHHGRDRGRRGALRRLRRPPPPDRRPRRADQRAGERPAPRDGQGPRSRSGGPALLQRGDGAGVGELPGLLPDVSPRRRHGLRRVLADARAPTRRRGDRRPPRRPARGHRRRAGGRFHRGTRAGTDARERCRRHPVAAHRRDAARWRSGP